MVISPSQYDAFWRCPERYRLSRLVRPADEPRPLAIGRAFHQALEAEAGEKEPVALVESDRELVNDLVEAYRKQAQRMEILHTECWYSAPLPGGHTLRGRLDGLARGIEGDLYALELKTTSRITEFAWEEEWRAKMQLRAALLGAGAYKGTPVAGLVLRVLPKTGARKLHEAAFFYESAELEAAALDLAQTAALISWLDCTYPDGPWPHPSGQWPCSQPGACEYSGVCGYRGAPEPDGSLWIASESPQGETLEGLRSHAITEKWRTTAE